ncbi:MAG: MlaD family protein [Chloroherpetonaceae bacterium]|nr:MlaD family protein [Chloroherpetonaceae bacterium]
MASTSGNLRWRDLRAGVVFVVGLVAAGALLLVVGRNSPVVNRFIDLKIFVQDIEGLAENNFVAISGKKVGTVQSMTIKERNDTIGVEVVMSVRAEFQKVITKDSKAKIKPLGVLGDKYVDITLGSGEPVSDGDFLAVEKDIGLADVTVEGERLIRNLNALLEKINRGEGTIGKLIRSSELVDRLERAAENLERVSASLASNQGLAGRLINDAELGNRFSAVAKDLETITASLREGKGTAGKLLVDESLYANLNGATKRLDSLVSSWRNPSGSIGKLAADSTLYHNLNRVAIALDSLLRDLKANPNRYINVRMF